MSGSFNGKTASIVQALIGAGAAALIGYYSGQIATNKAISDTNEKLTATNGRVDVALAQEQAHAEEVLRRLDRIERFIERIEATGADAKTGEPYRVQGLR